MTETSKLIPIRVLAVLALAAAACSVEAGNQIPCVEDFSCPNDYPVCVSGKCTAGTSSAKASVAVVGAEGHATTDFLSGTVRVIVSARASSGVKTVALAFGTTSFTASTPAATPPLYAFDVDTATLADGDRDLTATLTAGDGTVASATGTLHVDNAKPVITSFTVAGGASTTITAGNPVAISASFTGGTTATITDGTGSVGIASGGSLLVSPDTLTSYSLVVTSRSGVSVQSGTTGQPPNVSVAVAQRASTSGGNFTVAPSTIANGQSGTFTFTAPTFGNSVVAAVVKDGSGASVGSITSAGNLQIAIPSMSANTTQLAYTLVVSNAATTPDMLSIPVTVTVTPSVSSFNFQSNGTNAATFAPGSDVVFTHTYNAQTGTATINGVAAGASGSTTTIKNIQASTIYTLTVTNPAGISVTRTASATVSALVDSFSVGATQATSTGTATISSGATTKLFASFAGSGAGGNSPAALSCSPSCGATLGATTIANGGNVTVTGSNNGALIYTLTVSPSTGTPVATSTVTVNVVPLATATSLTAGSSIIHANGSTTLTPLFSFGTSPVVPGSATITGTDGSSYTNLTSGTPINIAPGVTTTFTLNVSNGAGTAATPPTPVTVTVAPGSWSALNTDAGAIENGTRIGASVTALGGGKVLVAGGLKGTTPLDTARVCDATGACNPTATSMASPRAYHTAVMIASGANAGKVLLAGGFTLPGPATPTTSAEFYDPTTNSFADTTVPITKGSVTSARARHVAVLLSDGSTVLIAGGIDGSTPAVFLNTALKYDASTPATANTGNMNQARADFTGTLLGVVGGTNLKVLIVGGKAGDSTAELYDPGSGTGTFTTITGTGSSVGEDKRSHTAVRITDPINQTGKVLISGGTVGATTPAPSAVQVLYDPNAGTAGTFTTLSSAPLATPRSNHAAIALSTDVLICGGTTTGTDTVSSCDLFHTSTGLPLPTPPMIEARKDFGLASITIGSIGMVCASGGTTGAPFTYAESYEPN